MHATLDIIQNAPLPTWFKIGGGAERLATPANADEIRACLELDVRARVLGDGANLLVDDDGIPDLVLSFKERLNAVEIEDTSGRVSVQAGANLPKLIVETVRRGLGGLEGLGGIPATIGGAIVMNAGGAFGQIADVVTRVHTITRDGSARSLERGEIDFSYRHSGLAGHIITGADLQLDTTPSAQALRDRLKEVMAYKAKSQPMAANSAGCCFKNPVLQHDLADSAGPIGVAGQRVSAGMLIDRAGLKGLEVRGAKVSERHGNFLVTSSTARARDVIDLIALVQSRVFDRFGVRLDTEVVIWSRHAISGATHS